MVEPQAFKDNERLAWDLCAERYDRCATQAFAPFSEKLLALARLHSGQHVLDVATGGGAAALMAAKLVGPGARVVGVDLSESMIALARQRAAQVGVHNVEFAPMDAEHLQFPADSFDVVLCALGLMLFPQPVNALSEMHRVLKAGGTAVLSVFGRGSRVALRALLEPFIPHMPSPEQRGPSIFGFGQSEVLAEAVKGGGFSEITTEQQAHVLTFREVEGIWEMLLSLGRLAQMHSRLSTGKQQQLKEQVFGIAREQFTSPQGALELPFEISYAVARP
ncbi:MAG TPA: methyltransferase domain-containing protein [Anaerolineae bacterium]|nr:methyltransferase domain-containing protein [Anaerolineae bacterium]